VDLRLVLDFGLMPGRQADHFAKELLVDLAEDFCRENRKFVGGMRLVKAFKNILENLVIDIERGSKLVGGLFAVVFLVKMKQARVITVISVAKVFQEPAVDGRAV